MATGDGTSTYAVVAPPPAEVPQVGLIASLGPAGGPYLDPPPAADDGRWEDGFQYRPERVCDGGGVTDPCASDMSDLDDQPDNVKFQPFEVWVGDQCSSFGWQANDYAGRATRGLLAVESKQIARELWTGTLAQAAGWPNAYLASPDSDVLTNGPAAAGGALDCLEQYLADCSAGMRGAIHCTAQLGSRLSQFGNTLRTAGGLIITYRGTVIIADAGYDGSGPDGQDAVDGSQWAYATLLPQVRRGAVVVSPGTMGEALDRSLNTVTWRAWRAAAATFPACCLGAAEIDMPLCLVGGVS